MDNPIRVIFIDDEPALRAIWERLLAAQPGMELAASLPNSGQLVDHAQRTGAAVAMMDLTIPGDDPLAAAAALSRDLPGCRVLIYSAHNDLDAMRRSYNAGAWGFVDKLDAVETILGAVRRVAQGELAFPPAFFNAS